MATGGSMKSRGPPDHLPTGPPALLLRHYGFADTVYYPMTPATTPLGTTTQRDQHLHPRRTPWAPELRQLQRRELNTDFSNAAVRDNSIGIPEGSTETTGHYYAAGRVLPTATPPNQVLLPVDPDRSTTSSPTPPPSSSPSSAPDTKYTYPAPRTCPRRTTTGGWGAVLRSPRATPAWPRLSTSPTSPTLTNTDTRHAYQHQPQDNRKDDDPAVRDIAASASPGGSTTGNAPDPGLRDPTETLPPPLYSWARTFPRVPGIRYPLSPFPVFFFFFLHSTTHIRHIFPGHSVAV